MAGYRQTIELCHLNSGAVHFAAVYPRDPIVELTVPYAVPDIARSVIDVTTR